MPPVGFKTTITARSRPKVNTLDRAATGIGLNLVYLPIIPFLLDIRLLQWVNRSRNLEAKYCPHVTVKTFKILS
jgi:hypothetical protein